MGATRTGLTAPVAAIAIALSAVVGRLPRRHPPPNRGGHRTGVVGERPAGAVETWSLGSGPRLRVPLRALAPEALTAPTSSVPWSGEDQAPYARRSGVAARTSGP
jgi:hypothetical protein